MWFISQNPEVGMVNLDYVIQIRPVQQHRYTDAEWTGPWQEGEGTNKGKLIPETRMIYRLNLDGVWLEVTDPEECDRLRQQMSLPPVETTLIDIERLLNALGIAVEDTVSDLDGVARKLGGINAKP